MAKPRDPRQDAARLLIPLARALHAYGMPTHRLEDALNHVRDALGVEAQFLVTPTAIQAAIGPDDRQRTVLLRVDAGETNLEKLGALTRVMQDVSAGRIDVRVARERVRAIVDAPVRYRPWLTVAAYLAITGSAGFFFGGGWREASVSAVIGLLLGLLAIWAVDRPRAVTGFPVVAALLATTIAELSAPALDPFAALLASLAGMIVLVPGLTLTIAINELAARHLVSGTARLLGAIIVFLQIGIGVLLGRLIAEAILDGLTSGAPAAGGLAWQLGSLPLAAAGFTILFRARPRDYPWILIAAGAAYACARLGGATLGPVAGAAAAAFVLGTMSNGFARLFNQPSATTLLPGLLMLVPGSIGFRSVEQLLRDDVVAGLDAAFEMVTVAVALVTGLFIANLAFPSRRLR